MALGEDEDMGYRPGTLEINDAALAMRLGTMLAPAGVHVEFRSHLELIEDCVEFLVEGILSEALDSRREGIPGYLSAPGITVDEVRGFADGASAFVRSGLWLGLGEDDLLEIVHPDAPQDMRYATVLAALNLHAIVFFPTAEWFWQFRDAVDPKEALECWRGLWHVAFLELEELPPVDQDLWHEHELPLAQANAHPSVMRMGMTSSSGPGRPNADQLAYLEGLLRALADTEEEELDTGHWTKEVSTKARQSDVRAQAPSAPRSSQTRGTLPPWDVRPPGVGGHARPDQPLSRWEGLAQPGRSQPGHPPGVREEGVRARRVHTANPHVPSFLLGDREPPERFATYQPGSEEEAAVCVDACAPAWESVSGAIEWLERCTEPHKEQGTKRDQREPKKGMR